ncbi:unnamed protein product [Parnassius apollo]|uniref:(apollo) hypothetical protein n=1 Tax=Parnassius apollo TaxID=110799 RepID=A0A8S3WVR0_PARAO|nr:unnamed protein product [Parnassius apollo]
MRLKLILSVLLLCAFSNGVHSARVLGLFPHTGKSHQMVFEPLLRTLAERGHHVTTVSFFPLKNPIENYTDISLEGISEIRLESLDLSMFETSGILSKIPVLNRITRQLSEMQPLADAAVNICEGLKNLSPLADALKREYDVVLVENFNSDCMLGLLHVYGNTAPKVALSSCKILPWTADRIGLPDNPAYVPLVLTSFTSRMNFGQRLENTFLTTLYKAWFYYMVQAKERSIIEKHFKTNIPDLRILAKNYSLMLVNTFHTLDGIRPMVPAFVEVGGMYLDHSREALPHLQGRSTVDELGLHCP